MSSLGLEPRLEDENQSPALGFETKSLRTLKTFAAMINVFFISITVNLSMCMH